MGPSHTGPGRIPLPPELIDMITSCLKGDLKSLKACALLGHVWATSARRHLFYSLNTYTVRRGRSIPLLLKLLQSTPFIPECIRELCLQGSVSSGVVRAVDATTVSILLERMPQLRVLSLQYMEYGGNSQAVLPSARYKLSKLRIRCRCVSKKSLRTFMEILSLFSELDELHLQENPYFISATARGPESQLPLNDPRLHIPKICAVSLERGCYAAILLLKAHLRISPHVLKKLSLPICGSFDFPNLLLVSREYGPHLEELEIQIGLEHVCETIWRLVLHPPSLSGIRTLSFIVSCLNQTSATFDAATSFLKILPSDAALRHVRIVFADNEVPLLEGWWWRAFDEETKRFAHLACVSVWQTTGTLVVVDHELQVGKSEQSILDRQVVESENQAFLKTSLPWLHERSLLQFA